MAVQRQYRPSSVPLLHTASGRCRTALMLEMVLVKKRRFLGGDVERTDNEPDNIPNALQ